MTGTNTATTSSLRIRRSIRAAGMAIMLGTFYALPWLNWEGQPALLLDIDARQFHAFGFSMQPGESLSLLWLALALIAALCMVTTLYGRLWCGYACPQSVLTRMLRNLARLATLPAPYTQLGMAITHAAWAGIALWTGITFVGYFSPVADLARNLIDFSLSGWEIFWISFYALATWANVLYLHEQVCTHLCPFNRVQHLISDARTPLIQYDAPRGEPRGARGERIESVLNRSRGLLDPDTARDYAFRAAHPAIAGALPTFAPAHLGDCIDCDACVSACPIGLDIRTGRSSSCIECSACIDACDITMERQKFPAGLIRRFTPASRAQDGDRSFRIKPLIFASAMLACVALAIVTARTLA
jgi:polyferredoxin